MVSITQNLNLNALDLESLNEIASLLADWTGNQITEKNLNTLVTKITNRMHDLHLKSINEYFQYFKSNLGVEKDWIISCFTIHHTYFFREYEHFYFLKKVLLEEFRKKTNGKFRILSAACSNGAEAYSLAMYIDDLAQQNNVKFDFEILGIDVDKKTIDFAENGVYKVDDVKKIPLELLSKYWLKGSGDISGFVKVKDSIKSKCKFQTGSLLEKLNLKTRFDMIFCRNVFIYFEPSQIKTASENLLSLMDENSHFIIGLSESLKGLELPVKNIGNSIYQKVKSIDNHIDSLSSVSKELIRVFIIDDSPLVAKLLSSILTEPNGFKVVGTALNGEEAKQKLDKKNVDIVTLDIHMPVLDGIGYLGKYFDASHPPVVMITSVDRTDSELSTKALELGASDFIEKPAMSRLSESGSEIKSKLRYVFENYSKGKKIDLKLEKTIKQTTAKLIPKERCLRVIFARDDGNKADIISLVDQFRKSIEDAPILIASESNIESIKNDLKIKLGDGGYNFSVLKSLDDFEAKTIYFASLHKIVNSAEKIVIKNRLSVMILKSAISLDVLDNLKPLKGSIQVLLEEPNNHQIKKSIEAFANDVTQMTSFDYLSRKYLCG